MEDKIIEYAPIIIVLLAFVWQNNIFVKPEQLEKKHREILKDIENKFDDIEQKFGNKFVELNAYKEFQSHIYSKLDELTGSIDDIKSFLTGKGR